ncbi:hypothetical protein MFIFM68171_01464 [Madurella fahalii]|uniref:Uncharacterized protein n=1 Tax=Madurella fahalii TaxID=1157608 RepID=A0ABQ0G0G7_9PEZI
MSNGMFFVSWELWQQMTFVLAMAIVAVFCAGLAKLWWNNRLMRKREVLDEEKRARLEEMRRTGLPMKRPNDIPFGVRAIQSGVEVDGIWISRPATPSETAAAKLASSTTLSGQDSDSQRKKVRGYSDDDKSASVAIVKLERPVPKQTPSDGSIFQKLNDSDSLDSTQSVAPPVSKFASRTKRPSSRAAGGLHEDTLRRLEGQGQSKMLYDTYMPTSSRRNPRQPSQRSSVSSSGDSVDSQPRSVSGKSYTSSQSSKLYMPRNPTGGRAGYDAVSRRGPEREGRDPFETPARTPSGFSMSQSDTHASLFPNQDLSTPEPTFGPGDLHLNKTSRRVNDGFEILPAGTFGVIG